MTRYLIPPEPKIVAKPNGRFFEGSFYWMPTPGSPDTYAEWGRQWLEGISWELAKHYPFYDKTGVVKTAEELTNEIPTR